MLYEVITKRVYEGSVEQSKMYEWYVELGNIKANVMTSVGIFFPNISYNFV